MTDPNRGGDVPLPEFGGYQGPPATGQFAPQPQYPPNPFGPPAPNPYAQPPNPYVQQPPYAQPYAYVGYPPVPPRGSGRPGTTIAAAVLGYVCAGLLIVAALILFSGASILSDSGNDFDNGNHYAAEFSINGVFNLIAAGLLIAGSVSMTGRHLNGRVMYSIGTGIVLVESIYWATRWTSKLDEAGVIFYVLLYAALVIIGVSLAWTSGVSRWLKGIAPA